MSRQAAALLLLTSLVVFVAASRHDHAETSSGVGPLPETVSIVTRAVGTPESGRSSEVASAGPGLHVGEEGTTYLATGGFDDDGQPRRALCASSVGTSIGPQAFATAVNVWTVRTQLLDATMDSLRIGVDWSRQQGGHPGELLAVAGDSRVLTLHEGESHTLDFELAPDGDLTCGRSLRIDVVAEVEEDPRFANELLDYDLWLIDEAPGQPTRRSHVLLEGRQGQRVDFALEPLVWPLEGVTLRDGRARVLATVSGTLRGRLREDGSVDLALDASRQLGVAGDSKPLGSVTDGGRKVLRVREDETLSLGLPSAQGGSTEALDRTWASTFGAPGMTPPAPTRQAVELRSDSVTVDFRRYFAGHEMSLRLTARRAPR